LDNISHTLGGLLVAECALELSRTQNVPPLGAGAEDAKQDRFRALALVSSALANNLPDFDFLYTGITGRPLGYLLHHRGHTHTLPVALALGVLTLLPAWLLAKRMGTSHVRLRALAALCLGGPLLHIGMDFANNYGVHPFWPLYDRWFYGDAIFIVEPTFWVLVIPPLVAAARSWIWRAVWAFLFFAILGAAWLVPNVARSSALALTALALATAIVNLRARANVRLALAAGACAIVTAIFFCASAQAKAILRRAARGAQIHDIALTPTPANPFCFDAWIVETHDGAYAARRALVAPLPFLVSAQHCPVDRHEHPTAPLSVDTAASNDEVLWRGAFIAPRAELRELTNRDCVASAFLRFARVPYWMRVRNEVVIGDLRYDRNPGLDFADIALAADAQCPRAVPPWTPPRRDVLETE
jgi:inner membrane protein